MEKTKTAKALEAVIAGEKVDKRLLESEAVRGVLTTFFFEKEARPELMGCIDHPRLMEEYLGLGVEEREVMQKLNNRFEGYLKGRLDMIRIMGWLQSCPSNVDGTKVLQLFKDINTCNAVNIIVQSYIAMLPKNKSKYRSLDSWFLSYNIETGELLKSQGKGKKLCGSQPQGIKYYTRWSHNKGKYGNSFKSWVEGMLRKDIVTALNETPFYKCEDITLQLSIRNYLKFKPKTRMGPVTLLSWWYLYDQRTGERASSVPKEKLEGTHVSLGSIFAKQWKKSKECQSEKDISEWVLPQIDEPLREELSTYLQSMQSVSIDTVILHYIDYISQSGFEKIGLQLWCTAFNTKSKIKVKSSKDYKMIFSGQADASKYVQRWHALNKHRKKKISFDNWMLSQTTNKELISEFNKLEEQFPQEITLAYFVENYLKFKPYFKGQPVLLSGFCLSHNVISGERVIYKESGKRIRLEYPCARKYYRSFAKAKKEKPQLTFEKWVYPRIPNKLRSRLKQYLVEINVQSMKTQSMKIMEIVKSYLRFMVGYDQDPLSLTTWFGKCNTDDGSRLERDKPEQSSGIAYYSRWLGSQEREKGIDFEPYVLAQIPVDLADEYRLFKASHVSSTGKP